MTAPASTAARWEKVAGDWRHLADLYRAQAARLRAQCRLLAHENAALRGRLHTLTTTTDRDGRS